MYIEVYDNIVNSRNYEKLTQTEKDIHLFIVKHIEEIDKYTVEQIAKKCFCSTASINRYAKSMGAKSYTEMKFLILEHHNQTVVDGTEKIQNRLINKANNVNVSDIDKICNLIIEEDYLYIFGTGSSFILARYFQRLLSKLGINSIAFNEPQNLLMMRKINMCIVISNTGETFSSVQVANDLSERSILVGITKEGSRVDNLCSYSIVHNDENIVEKSFNRELGIESFMAILMLITSVEAKLNEKSRVVDIP